MLSGRPLLYTAGDRRYLVERAEEGLVLHNVQAGLNTLLLAERGMGKTTLLRQLQGRLEEELDLKAVYLDARRLEDAAMILLSVRDALEGPRNAIAESLRTSAMSFAPTPVELRNEEALRLVRDLESGMEGRQACILLDEPDPESAHRLFGRLRDELWQTGLTWVVAGDQARRQQYLTPPADAFFERVLELKPFTQAQQLELVQKRLEGRDDDDVVGVTIESGNPRALLAALRDAAGGHGAQEVLARRADRERRAAKELGPLASLMLAEIEDGASASASDRDWLSRFGISRQRAQQVLTQLEGKGFVRAERLPGPSGRPRKMYRRLEAPS